MGNIRGITVEVGGDVSPLDKALKGVDKTTRSLQTELRKVETGLKFNPNNIELTRQKQTLLKKEISETTDKLKMLKSTQDEVKKLYGEGKIDDGRYREFQRELITTKSKLGELKAEEKSVSVVKAAFGQLKDAAQGVIAKLTPLVNGLKKVGEAGATITSAGVQTVGKAVDVAGQGLKIYTGAVTAAGVASAGLAIKAAGSADDLNTMAKTTGLSTETLQKFKYSSDIIDVSMDTLTGSLTKVTKNMGAAAGGSKSMQANFDKLGVSIYDSNGNLRDNEDVMNDSIGALGKMTNETERDAMAMEIFGKSAQDLNPLIMGGADALKTLGDEASASGMILSQDALDAANEFGDSLDGIKAKASSSGNILGGVFAKGLLGSSKIISDMIPQVTGSLANLFSGQNMEGSKAKLTTDLINGFTQIIQQLVTQLPQFLAGFEAVIVALITAISAVLPELITTLVPVLIGGFTSLIQALIPLIPILLPIIIDGAMQLFMGLLDGLNLIIPQLMAMMPELINSLSTILIDNLPLIITSGIQLLISLIKGITNSIPQLITSVIALIPVIVDALVDNLPELIKAGIDLIVALATGLPKAIPNIIAALPEIIAAIIDGIVEVNWLQVGIDVIKGIAGGLIAGVKNISFSSIGNSILGGIKKVMGIHSPSTMFRDQVGVYLASGLGVGFEDEMKYVKDDMAKAIPTSFDIKSKVNASGTVSGTNGANSLAKMGASVSIVIENFVNNTTDDIHTLMNEIGFETQRQLAGGGYVGI